MCLVFVGWRAHPRYRLVVAANRDEFHARPTAPAAPWEAEARGRTDDETFAACSAEHRGARCHADADSRTVAVAGAGSGGGVGGGSDGPRRSARRRILAGRDLKAGGTWLGVAASGRFAALTNVGGSTPPGPGAPSRGRLPVDFLHGTLGAREHARAVAREADRYSGFNLLLADRDSIHCVTNRGGERLTELAPGCHGLGNDRLNAREPKVTRGLAEFSRRLAAEPMVDELFALLADDEPAVEADPRGSDLDRVRSARFIRGDVYGTRSSTVLTVEGTGAITFEERSFDTRAVEAGRVAFARPAGAGAEFAANRTPGRLRDAAAD